MGFEDAPNNFKKYKLKNGDNAPIEPHEILADAEVPNFSEREEGLKLETPIKNHVIRRLFYFSVCIFLILLGRSFYLQVSRYDYYYAKSEKNASRVYQIPSLRGIIYDAKGNQLVFNEPAFDIIMSPGEMPKGESEFGAAVERIAAIVGRGKEELQTALDESKESKNPFILISNVPREAALALISRSAEFPGFGVQQAGIRRYAEADVLSHIFGYLGKLTEPDVKNNPEYSPTDYIGKTGLEAEYEKILRGKPGLLEVEVDALGRPKRESVIANPENGKNLVLSLELDLQKKLYEEMKKETKSLKVARGAALAMDPSSGEILAMVSLPSFDGNLFGRGISARDYRELIENSDKPLFNRAIAGTYPSGSTIKPLLASAALQENVIGPEKTILSTGGIDIVNKYNNEIIYTFGDWKIGGHGAVNVIKAIAESVNTYFYTIGGGHGDVKGLGVEKIKKYLGLFGWGGALGVDLPGEKDGLIPDPRWKESVKGENWYIGDTYNISIGQGDIAVTPLQVTAAVAAIANGGTLYQPKFVKKIAEPSGKSDEQEEKFEEVAPKIIGQGFVSAKNLEIVRKGMREAVISGSSRALYDLPVKAAGKTGTAQFAKNKTHAWFSGFAPYENPEIVVTVLIEGGGEGSAAAVPVAKEVLKWYFERQK